MLETLFKLLSLNETWQARGGRQHDSEIKRELFTLIFNQNCMQYGICKAWEIAFRETSCNKHFQFVVINVACHRTAPLSGGVHPQLDSTPNARWFLALFRRRVTQQIWLHQVTVCGYQSSEYTCFYQAKVVLLLSRRRWVLLSTLLFSRPITGRNHSTQQQEGRERMKERRRRKNSFLILKFHLWSRKANEEKLKREREQTRIVWKKTVGVGSAVTRSSNKSSAITYIACRRHCGTSPSLNFFSWKLKKVICLVSILISSFLIVEARLVPGARQ